VSLFSLSSSRDDRFRLREGIYLKNKITTAEKRTKLLIIEIIGEGGLGILKTLFPLIEFFCDLAVRLQIQKGSTVSQQIVT